ncbi:MAG: DUF2231 domain-containing protein [Chloroflexota bacterium]
MQIAGIPAHPLMVHAAVVLVPLALLGYLGLLWRVEGRRTYGWLVTGVAVAGAVAAILAAQSGESLEHALRLASGARPQFGEHPDQGDTAEFLSVAFGAAVVALWGLERFGARWPLPAWTPTALYVLGALVGLAATGMIVVAGHSGATLAWDTLGTFVKPK